MPTDEDKASTRRRYVHLFRHELEEAQKNERLAAERAADIKEMYAKDVLGRRRSTTDLDVYISSDSQWKVLVANQQFANRKAQMYGLAALIESMDMWGDFFNELLTFLHRGKSS